MYAVSFLLTLHGYKIPPEQHSLPQQTPAVSRGHRFLNESTDSHPVSSYLAASCQLFILSNSPVLNSMLEACSGLLLNGWPYLYKGQRIMC